jgi:hypothetical protein
VAITQRKYALDIPVRLVCLIASPVTPMDPKAKLLLGQGKPLKDPVRYQHLVVKLNYLIVIRLDITFAVSVVNKFRNAPYDNRRNHLAETITSSLELLNLVDVKGNEINLSTKLHYISFPIQFFMKN